MRENTRCASRSRPGSIASMAGAKRAGSPASAARGRTQMSWMLAFPQTPHALVVRKLRRAPGATVTPGARVTSAMLPSPSWSPWPQAVPSQSLISAMSAAERITASPARNPAASSRSSPGVRMVMVSAVPSTLIPSGSSAASRSARGVVPPGRPSSGSVIRSTRRRAVRPDNDPPFRSASPSTGYARALSRRAAAGVKGCAVGLRHGLEAKQLAPSLMFIKINMCAELRAGHVLVPVPKGRKLS